MTPGEKINRHDLMLDELDLPAISEGLAALEDRRSRSFDSQGFEVRLVNEEMGKCRHTRVDKRRAPIELTNIGGNILRIEQDLIKSLILDAAAAAWQLQWS